jgi:hypothetical protein
MEKFRISIIDFLPQYGRFDVGKYEDGANACLGDMVERNGEKWFIAYRYGKVMLKQIGMMAMIGNESFDAGDFSSVKKLNIIGAGEDWLIIGYTNEPMYGRLKSIIP